MIRRRIKEHGQLVVAVEPNLGSEQMQLRAIRTADGASWWYAFTSFEEELKGAEPVQSTFLVDMDKLFDAALAVPEISGIILNPWNRTISWIRPSSALSRVHECAPQTCDTWRKQKCSDP